MLDLIGRKAIQAVLKSEAGFDPGLVDGMWGPKTQNAWSGFVGRFGKVSPDTLGEPLSMDTFTEMRADLAEKVRVAKDVIETHVEESIEEAGEIAAAAVVEAQVVMDEAQQQVESRIKTVVKGVIGPDLPGPTVNTGDVSEEGEPAMLAPEDNSTENDVTEDSEEGDEEETTE